ncbi:MMPL family transporter [Planomonospora venezuelensis]|uniref:RND superfamily putative drug exporter n=1 Tax=Planomonospora venezuelensis TaxID=1999 RepID=A0A841D2A3_PLAVE|nr:MMPL family transporter [Planomonospora venezuelensis]MBB5964802.1 RND superfamily putative drug exporter [Planomonospora venezuelensis]GIM99289.1 membrane protein [Planomonospora venezuelensis]
MERLSASVLRHKRLVMLLAVLAFLVGLGATPFAVQRLSEEYAHPGMPAFDANREIVRIYGNGGYQRPFVPVVVLPDGMRVEDRKEEIGRAFAAVSAKLPQARVVSYADTGDARLVGADGRTTFGLVFPGTYSDGSPPGGGLGETPDESPVITAAMSSVLPQGSTVRVTGLDTLAPSVDVGGVNVPSKIAIGVAAAVVVLLLVFRSALALVPILISVLAIFVSFVVILLLTFVTTVHDVALTTMPLLGLGIAVDYSLLLVARWREEQGRGHRGDEAVHRAMRGAGRAVLFSGTAVAIGLVTMVVLPVPFLRSLGLAGMVIAAASVAVTLTVLPVLLALAGQRLERRRGAAGTPTTPFQREAKAGRAWSAWARGVVRLRWPAALLTGGLLVALTVTALGVDLGLPESGHLRTSGPGHEGLTALHEAGVPAGSITPFDTLVTGDPAEAVERIKGVEGVSTVLAPDNASWRRDGTAVVTVLPVAETGGDAGQETITRVREAAGAGVRVGGNAAQSMDFQAHTYGAFPWMLALIALATFVMLARAFRSLLLPVKAIALNLLSLGAVIGAMVLLWQFGWGTRELLDIQPTGSIGEFVPLTIFAFLYGLSMDYEVFILARMREEYDSSGDTEHAVIEGVGRTGRLVTSAALILFISFAALAMTPELDVKVFASGLALGILLDATLVRGVLVPAVVAMMGRWNWWLPAWAARPLRVEPSPLRTEPPRGRAPRKEAPEPVR